MDRNEAEKILKGRFGINKFYDEQWDAVSRILNGERILMIQRTGFGKSLCYQFPAIIFDGVTIVFSPLIALMRDQVKSLKRKGIAAAYVNSEQSPEENTEAIRQAIAGDLKILYIAPERQENREWIEATRQMPLSMVVIDEAHTISTWGHDFRPAYRRIIDLVNLLPSHLPVLATTATATIKVQHDIESQIGGTLTTIRGSLSRPNFRFYVIKVKSEEEKLVWLADNIRQLDGTGIIYTGTRNDTEKYSRWLQYLNIDAIDYHAGFDADRRKEIENGLMSNRWKCIISTNALGMGLDKPDIRFIIHTQIPASPVHYYQEIGRAGRDGLPADIILFYNDTIDKDLGLQEDMKLQVAFIENSRPSLTKYMKVIDLLKEEPLSEREIIIKANLKTNQIRIIKSDLMEQGILKEVIYGKQKKYEYSFNAPMFEVTEFEIHRQKKMDDLKHMVEYINTKGSRMEFLCSYLDSREQCSKGNCDNTGLMPLCVNPDSESFGLLHRFYENFFPILEVADVSTKRLTRSSGESVTLSIKTMLPGLTEIMRNQSLAGRYKGKIPENDFDALEFSTLRELWDKHTTSKSHLTDGIAASYYGISGVGAMIHKSKYENGGDFPQYLVDLTAKAFHRHFHNLKFDFAMFVPPTKSGNLVKDFAIRLGKQIGLKVSDNLIKIQATDEQKTLQNSFSKRNNVAGAFGLSDPEIAKDARILLIDDIFDSGATIKEIGKMLTQAGAKYVVPIVIARTIGGSLLSSEVAGFS